MNKLELELDEKKVLADGEYNLDELYGYIDYMAQTGRNILIGAAIAAAVAAGAGGTYIYRKRHQIDDADDMME